MCGEFINPLHYYSNLQQFPVSSKAPMGMLMGHISVGLLDHSGGGSILPQPFTLRVSDSGLLCIPLYIMARPIDTRRKLTQQVVNSSNITQLRNVLVQTAFSLIPFLLSVLIPDFQEMLLTATCSNLWEVETLEYLFSGHFLGTEKELNRKAQDALLTSETTNLSLIDQHNVLAPNSISVIAPTLSRGF